MCKGLFDRLKSALIQFRVKYQVDAGSSIFFTFDAQHARPQLLYATLSLPGETKYASVKNNT